MVKKKESIFQTWEEIDTNLKELGKLSISKSKLEGELTLKINEITDKYRQKIEEINNKTNVIKKEITRFCEQNKQDFINKRSRKLNFGNIAYRISETLKIDSVATAIKALKALDLNFCLKIKEELIKDEIKKLDSSILAKIGARIITKDNLNIEPNIIEIVASEENE